MQKTQYRANQAAHTGRGPSPNLWHNCPVMEIIHDPGRGIHFFDDFIYGGKITAPTTEAALVGIPLSGFSSSASQITNGNATYTTGQDAGTIILAETTNDESTNFRSAVTPFRISANFGALWFEARIKVSHTATTEQSFFVGLIEDVAGTAAIPLTATGALSDHNLVGFHKPEANTTAYDTSYKANTVTAVEVNSDVGALVAGTYVKLGMFFNPDDDNKLSFYIDGVKQASTKTVPDNTGTDFPADVALGPIIALGVGAAASDNTITIDWWRAAQLFT